ncbi:ribbon-helix-helix protein, CopG family [Christensenellaceae bacterium NSJ-44]|uniref:Ribbon-helix-helix protein, CopG family n=1 Tax=Luoshenia tenuis TaxID=2763654 RepID=A0A926D1F0_9FIRM|nr:ribbon-helix-helix protein, CopG family [Luoshenia tenuis]MBC8529602.1 ribbon-helix-helix protein, CopG family [Luoshenia tenuis]
MHDNFIPKPYRKNPITIRIPPDKIEQIDQLAAQYDISRSSLINQCIDYGLDHLLRDQDDRGPGPSGGV